MIPRRSLPATYVDLIRDGVPSRELRVRGETAVWSALVRTASSALQRGWSRQDWQALLEDPRSNLGRQTLTDDRQRVRTPKAVQRAYDTAWGEARRWLAENPPMTRADAEARIEDVAEIVHESDLQGSDRAVMEYACITAASIGTDRPALPVRGVAAGTGLGERVVRTSLARLSGAGWLGLEVRGSPNPHGGRASCYRLMPGVDTHTYRENRSVCRVPMSVCRSDPGSLPEEPMSVCRQTGSEYPMRVTFEGSADELARLWDLARANGLPVPGERPESGVVLSFPPGGKSA